MAAMEQPFSETEVRYFLAEILKKSSIAPLDLLNLIRERGIQPSWYEIALPNGRSVSSCIVVWQNLQANTQARFQAPVQPMVAFEQSQQNASKPKIKHPASGENYPSAVDRMIQPQQPFNFPPVNASDSVTAPGSAGQPKKKRGRPSKAEYEAKVAEAAARGEDYQPAAKRKKTPRPSPQGAPNVGIVTPAGESPTSMKKARKPKAALEEASSLAFPPTARSCALDATAYAADQMQFDEERPVQSTMSETQASEVEARESLLANMREHAEHTAPYTVQNNTTLRHGSIPQNDFTSFLGPTRGPATTRE